MSATPEEAIAKIMEIFYIQPKLRTPVDTIEILNGVARISVWKSIPPEPDASKIECNGYQWLLGGRGKKIGAGASEVFEKVPSVNKIILEFVELEFSTKSTDKHGKFQKTAKKRVYLTIAAAREKLKNFSLTDKVLKASLQGSVAECLKVGRSVITEKEILL